MSSRTTEQYLKRGESHVTGKSGGLSGPGEAVGKDGWRGKVCKMSKHDEEDQFHV